MMITKAKKVTPRPKVIFDKTFSGPLSLRLANKPKSPEPVKALKPSDLPLCKSEIIINRIETTNNNKYIICS